MQSVETFSFITDVHGNLKNIDAFLRESKERGTNHIIFGGDIAPKKMAISFPGNKSLKVSSAAALPNLNLEQSVTVSDLDAYENGYMLFPSGISLEQLQKLQQVLTNLQRDTRGNEEVSLEEIQFIESILLPMLKNFITTSPIGKKVWDVTKTERERNGLNDIAKALKYYLIGCKSKHLLGTKQFFNIPIRNELLFGKNLEEAVAREHISYGITAVEFINRSIIPKLALYGTPTYGWTETYYALDRHALAGQRRFIRDLIARITELRASGFRGTCSVILGNDDDTDLMTDLDEAEKAHVLYHVSNRVKALTPQVAIAGYSYVPPIPGVSYDAWFKSEAAIQKQLGKLLKETRRYPISVANIHCPPFESKLDQAIVPGLEVTSFGSTAVRSCLEKHRPTISLHGHIHESHIVSGSTEDVIGKTRAYNPGASEYTGRYLFGNLART